MIYDSVERFITELPEYMPRVSQLTEFLSAAREKSFEELKEMDFAPLDLRFGEYETKPQEEIPFEAHKRYWDLQLVLEGEELLGYAPLAELTETVAYAEKDDIAFYRGEGQNVKLSREMAVLLAPWDGHRPGANGGDTPCKIKKIVVKLPW